MSIYCIASTSEIFDKGFFTSIGILLSFVVGFTGLIISYKNSRKTIFINSVTASRIKWIDNLRENASVLCGIIYNYNISDLSDNERNIIRKEVDKLNYLIKLQLNASAHIDSEIIILIDEILKLTDRKDTKGALELKETLDKFVSKTQTLLKFEWERVKKESIKGNLSEKKKKKLFDEFITKFMQK